MSASLILAAAFLVLVVLLVVMLIVYYNRFVRIKNQAGESMSGIEVQLKRRYDLIPNLVETVKGYATHEKETLENVIKARNMAVNASGPAAQGQAENMLTGALKSIFALSESYPDLKANQNFIELSAKLSELETEIQHARRYYNAIVREYNNLCETFPSVIVAGVFSYRVMEFLDFDDAVHENVKVSF